MRWSLKLGKKDCLETVFRIQMEGHQSDFWFCMSSLQEDFKKHQHVIEREIVVAKKGVITMKDQTS